MSGVDVLYQSQTGEWQLCQTYSKTEFLKYFPSLWLEIEAKKEVTAPPEMMYFWKFYKFVFVDDINA